MNQQPLFVTKSSFSKTKYTARHEFLFKHYKPGKILDIGNIGGIDGIGNQDSPHLQFVEFTKNDSRIYGFDLHEPADKKLYPNQKQGDLEQGLPYSPGFFDTVYLGEVLEHVSNPGIVLDNIKMVLKKNGVFILDVPNPYSWYRLLKYLIHRYEEIGNPTHLIFFTPALLQALLYKHGFKILELATKFPSELKLFPESFSRGLGTHLLIKAQPI